MKNRQEVIRDIVYTILSDAFSRGMGIELPKNTKQVNDIVKAIVESEQHEIEALKELNMESVEEIIRLKKEHKDEVREMLEGLKEYCNCRQTLDNINHLLSQLNKERGGELD